MTPFASVAILEKLALLKIALCRAPVFSRASAFRTMLPSAASAALFVGITLDMYPDASTRAVKSRPIEDYKWLENIGRGKLTADDNEESFSCPVPYRKGG